MSGKKKVMEHDPLMEVSADEKENEAVPDPNEGVANSPQTDSAVLDFAQTLTISEVSEWQEKMLFQCDAGNNLTLNGGEIEMVDGAGLQLLAALMKEIAERQIVVTWLSASDQLKQAAENLGLKTALGLDESL